MQVQNNKEEVPFAHYEEKFRALDPIESAKRCGVPFADGKFSVRLLGVTYQITWPDYAITADRDGAFGLSSLPCQTFLLRFLLEGRQAVQIAQAKSPLSGASLWEDITSLLFGNEQNEPSAADALSLFWPSGD